LEISIGIFLKSYGYLSFYSFTPSPPSFFLREKDEIPNSVEVVFGIHYLILENENSLREKGIEAIRYRIELEING